MGGESVMIWACSSVRISVHVPSSIAVVSGNQTGEKYSEGLQNNLLPFAKKDHSDAYLFMIDGAQGYSAILIKVWFLHHSLEALAWPVSSHNLKPILSLRAIIVLRAYGPRSTPRTSNCLWIESWSSHRNLSSKSCWASFDRSQTTSQRAREHRQRGKYGTV